MVTAGAAGLDQPWQVGVIVPARDEEARIGRALRAIERAAKVACAGRPGTSVTVHVVLDACSDRTEEIVATHPRVRAVTVGTGRVGSARAAGVEDFAQLVRDPRRAWVANTDADSEVPVEWLLAHLSAADAGYAMVAGTVVFDLVEAGPELRVAIAEDSDPPADGHDHVYGANLGLTLAAYRVLGGFPDVRAHEDVTLVHAARAAGLPVLASGSAPVLTSPRLRGRAPEGVAAYLRNLLDKQDEAVAT